MNCQACRHELDNALEMPMLFEVTADTLRYICGICDMIIETKRRAITRAEVDRRETRGELRATARGLSFHSGETNMIPLLITVATLHVLPVQYWGVAFAASIAVALLAYEADEQY